jgi:hypothetical protein
MNNEFDAQSLVASGTADHRSGELAVRVLPNLVELAKPDAGQCYISWPMNTEEDRELAYRARHNEAADLSDLIGKELALTRFVLHHATKGESARPFVRIVLVDVLGKMYESGSRGVLDCIVSLQSAYGLGPWLPAVRVKVIEVDGNQPNPMQKLELLGRAPAPKGK